MFWPGFETLQRSKSAVKQDGFTLYLNRIHNTCLQLLHHSEAGPVLVSICDDPEMLGKG